MNRASKTTRWTATLADVAREAGVSKNAVSVVLNGAKESTRVSDATRLRILDAAGRLQYRPNASAQSLVRGRTNIIGVLFGDVQFVPADIQDEYGATILQGIMGTCANYDFNITLFVKPWFISHNDITVYRDQGTDGIVVIAPSAGSGVIEGLVSQGVYVSAVSYPGRLNDSTDTGWDSVDTDNILGARMATEYLLRLGHRRIAHLMGTTTLVSAQQRYAGYREALENNAIPFAEELVIQRVGAKSLDGAYSGKYAAEDTRRLLALPDSPTAIFAANDAMAAGVLREASELGVKVPEQLSVIGFDDRLFTTTLSPPLTTVRQPLVTIGEKVAELLIKRILGRGGHSEEEAATLPTTHLFAPELIVRGTTGPEQRIVRK
ncbi:MAG: LacI family DNA-binding transcriptional regulator [Armatimonadetes bacterium]|nr:LacI family DNA-binding transcriptional regulator [Armatimonadota bacterium]